MALTDALTISNINAVTKPGGGATLSQLAINKATNFVQGKATTALTKLTSDALQDPTTMSSLKIAATVTGVISRINPKSTSEYADIFKEELIGLGTQLLEKCTTQIVSYGTKHLVRIIGPFLSPPDFLSEIMSRAGKRAIAYISNEIVDETREDGKGYFMTKGELLESLIKSAEDISKREQEKKKKKKSSKFVNDLIKNASEVKKLCDDYLPQVESYISLSLTYIENGPDYVDEYANKMVSKALSYIDTKVTKYSDKIIDKRDQYIDKAVDGLAYQMALQMDAVRQKAIETAHALLEKTKSKTLIVAWSLMQKAVLKIMALTGISIPI